MGFLRVVHHCCHCIVCLDQFFALNLGVLIDLHRDRIDIVHQLFSLSKYNAALSYDFCIEIHLALQPKCIFIKKLLLLTFLASAGVLDVVVLSHTRIGPTLNHFRVDLLLVTNVILSRFEFLDPSCKVRAQCRVFLRALFLSKN